MTHYHPCDDVPIVHSAQDKLNRSRLASRLLEAIQFAPLPQVMGVEGDWGSGKTSLLQNLFWRIEKKVPREMAAIASPRPAGIPHEGPQTPAEWKRSFSTHQGGRSTDFLSDENVRAVWFEAWRYQHEPEPVIALLHEIRSQLLTGDKWEQRSKRLWKKMGAGAEVFLQGLFAATNEAISSIQMEAKVPLLSKFSIKMPDVGKHVKAASEAQKKELMGEPLKSEMQRKNLDLAISLFLGDDAEKTDGEGKRLQRLVIIIDDLDRCSPDAVCRLLESIKIHLDLPSCFFVLGLNRRHVENSLTSKLVDAFHSNHDPDKEVLLRARASDYIEKICTNLIRIPRPDREGCVALAEFCMSGADWPQEWKEAAALSLGQAFGRVLKEGRYLPLPSNPRRIKALCNQFQLTLLNAHEWLNSKAAGHRKSGKATREKAELEHVRSLFIMAALRQFFPDIYRMIEAVPRFYSELHRWCKDGSSGDKIFVPLKRIVSVVAGSNGTGGPGTPGLLLPDPHEGISFFIQELVVLRGLLTEDEIKDLLSAI